MVGHSIVAVVLEADHESNELTFDLAQRGGSSHRRRVEAQVGIEPPRIQGVDDHDVVDAAVRGIHDLGVQVCKGPALRFPVTIGNGPDPCHRVSFARPADAGHRGRYRYVANVLQGFPFVDSGTMVPRATPPGGVVASPAPAWDASCPVGWRTVVPMTFSMEDKPT